MIIQITSSVWFLLCQALWGYESSQVMFSQRMYMLEVGNGPGRHKKLHSVYCRCSDKKQSIYEL